jgi:hypothetical protein
MSAKELKFEIQRTLDNVSENVLQDILDYLKEFERHSSKEISLSCNLRNVLIEDKNLLERLAK